MNRLSDEFAMQTLEPGATHSPAAELERLLASRYSCRAYQPDPVPRTVIERILHTAQRTASWCNTQPWHVLITTGEGTKRFSAALLDQIAGNEGATDFDFPREYKDAYLARRRECGGQLYESLGIGRGDRERRSEQALENFRFFGAPHVAIVAAPEALGVYGAVDCGAYVSNFMLAAHSVGVGSVAQAALALQSRFIREYFDMGDDWRVVCGISFGYPQSSHPVNQFRTSRAPVEDVVRWVHD